MIDSSGNFVSQKSLLKSVYPQNSSAKPMFSIFRDVIHAPQVFNGIIRISMDLSTRLCMLKT